jgi:hypothetical protein
MLINKLKPCKGSSIRFMRGPTSAFSFFSGERVGRYVNRVGMSLLLKEDLCQLLRFFLLLFPFLDKWVI